MKNKIIKLLVFQAVLDFTKQNRDVILAVLQIYANSNNHLCQNSGTKS